MDNATLQKLKELGSLKDQGILSEEEFAAQKSALLSSGGVPQGQPMAAYATPPLVALADPAEQLRIKQEHELKLEQMKLEAKQEDNRRQEQLAAERMNNQLMLAQTAQTAASKASAAPVMINNNVSNVVAPVQATAPVVVQVQGSQFYADPGCCMKCCCPVCAVCTTYGTCCKCPHMLLACVFGCAYTMCCWSPSTERRP